MNNLLTNGKHLLVVFNMEIPERRNMETCVYLKEKQQNGQ